MRLAALAVVAACGGSPAPAPAALAHATPAGPEAPGGRPEIVELKRIIVEAGGGPTVDPARKPSSPLDPGWDPANVWMTEYRQTGSDVTLIGQGNSEADLVQLVVRLQISQQFDRVTVRRSERRFDPERGEHGQDVYDFEITLVSLDRHPPREPISITEW